ncbi:MAG: DUF4339 domain-containing protein [Opitutales bacterium]
MSRSFYFTDAEGKILGPCSESEIRAFYDTGHIDADTDVCPEDGTEWIPLVKAIDLSRPTEPQPASAGAEPNQSVTPTPASLAAAPALEGETGMSLRGLLLELAERSLQVKHGDAEPQVASIENVGRDVITITFVESGDVVHFPLSRLKYAQELSKYGGLILSFE